MNTLKQRINTDYITAFKAKEEVKKKLLSVIKGEIQTAEKNTASGELTEDAVQKILFKFQKNTKETIEKIDTPELREELSIIEFYLPKQKTTDEIKSELPEAISSVGATTQRDMGKIIGYFNSKYPGQVNTKELSALVGQFFTAQATV